MGSTAPCSSSQKRTLLQEQETHNWSLIPLEKLTEVKGISERQHSFGFLFFWGSHSSQNHAWITYTAFQSTVCWNENIWALYVYISYRKTFYLFDLISWTCHFNIWKKPPWLFACFVPVYTVLCIYKGLFDWHTFLSRKHRTVGLSKCLLIVEGCLNFNSFVSWEKEGWLLPPSLFSPYCPSSGHHITCL